MATVAMTTLEAALNYAARGWPVLPIKAGAKQPLTQHGLKDATTDHAVIEQWWSKWPDANVAIRTGSASGVFVLDVDPRHGGNQALEELCNAAELPDTPTAETANGGLHLFFACPNHGETIKNAVNIKPGLDLRGENGYVVGAPSVLADGGRYVWQLEPDETQLQDPPAWLAELLEAPKGDTTNFASPGENGAIPAGARNQTLTKIAGSLRRYGSSEDEILDTLRTHNKRCEPPLNYSELQQIAGSVARYAPTEDFAHTDLGNAERFAAQHTDKVRYVHAWRSWLIWNGTRWQSDESGAIYRLASDTVRSMYAAAADITDKGERQALVAHAKSSESNARLKAMLELAQSLLPVSAEKLDSDPWLLGVENGVVDLRTGELREAQQSDLTTKQAAVRYDPAATCDTWLRFLKQIFDGDFELITFVQVALAYSLTGDLREQCLFVCHGAGSNGKSTLLRTIEDLLGDYAVATPPTAILHSKHDGIPNALARLRGVRFTSVLELEQGRRLHEPVVKALTGGDSVAVRFLHGEYFDLNPQFKAWLGTNHKPRILGQDQGIWRRIRLIPFTVEIPAAEQDKDLLDKLRAERPGILRWLLEGLERWQREGLGMPEAVANATSEYRTAEDTLAEFVEAYLRHREGARTASSEIYAVYQRWCEDNGEKAQAQRWLTARLEERGYKRQRTKVGRLWFDVEVKG